MNTKTSSATLGGAYLKREPHGFSKVWRFVPGLLLAGVIALVATQLASLPWLKERGLGALTMAIVLGMLVGNTVYPRLAAQAAHGVTFSKQKLLRLGIILYGFHLTFQDIGQVGVAGVVIDALVLSSTFGLAMLLGTRVFGLDRKTTLLIGAGSSICGAAAVMATEPVVRGRAEQVTVAVSTVVVFGTVSMFLYPALYRWSVDAGVLPMTEHAFGVFAGSTIHEVAQAVAAGAAVSPQAADTAVIAKMVRVMMLAPFLLILSSWLQRNPEAGDPPKADISGGWLKRLNIPWFALGFIAVAGLNSLSILPPAVVSSALTLDALLLAMAMAALGLTTHASALKTAGVRPLLLATALFAWLLCGGLAINQIVPWLASLFA